MGSLKEMLNFIGTNEIRLLTLDWLCSLSFCVSVLLVILGSLCYQLLSREKNKSQDRQQKEEEEKKSLTIVEPARGTWNLYVRYYFVRGFVFFRLFYLGTYAAVATKTLLNNTSQKNKFFRWVCCPNEREHII
eukprot:TRINITY_DN3120_c0_g2_i1.p4 TRINITY_DN3120_c0_g2~~TRINITY_DN3120_c0_g2_i1.p4  ORF type:complete len:133 (+),score=7.10 TRINITY_DN3120_c0_g2_i1:37-435(+)